MVLFYFAFIFINIFIGFSKSLAKELGSKNIRVNVIAPGFIETDMISGKEEKFFFP